MKLRNKKTGEILESARTTTVIKDKFRIYDEVKEKYYTYNSLAELNAEWEDYEEPKGYWSYDTFDNDVTFNRFANEDDRKADQEIGNYFNTREEAEKAVEKLKAWKRLKDKGFRFCGWATNEGIRGVDFEVPDSFFSEHNYSCISDETRDDLDLLFGGEE